MTQANCYTKIKTILLKNSSEQRHLQSAKIGVKYWIYFIIE